jgi:transitional endoplasmic reticulum ATPase
MSTSSPESVRGVARYLLGGAAFALLYLVLVPVLWLNRGVVENGPLSFTAPALAVALLPGQTLGQVEARCSAQENVVNSGYERVKVVGGRISDRPYYGCFGVRPDGAVGGAAVLDQDLFQVKDVQLLKRSGAWRWIGGIKTRTELVLGFLGLVAMLGMYLLYYRRPRPGPRADPNRRWWMGRAADAIIGFLPLIGWLLIWVLPGRSRARRTRLSFVYGFAWVPFFLFGAYNAVFNYPDVLSIVVVSLLGLAILWGWLGGIMFVRVAGWGYPDTPVPVGPRPEVPWGQPVPSPSVGWPSPGRGNAAPPAPPPGAVPSQTANRSLPAQPAAGGLFKAQPPDQLPTFAEVGGMSKLKDLLSDTFGLLLAYSDQAERYRITFNGILLHGPPGVGKTFVAKATAGEFGLNFVRVVTGDLISKWLGESAKNVSGAFRFAAARVPCVLFFDEFDSVALRRDDEPDNESRRVVNQLLSSLEEFRDVHELIVIAATNRLERLDPAAIRPGRFDRHVRVDLPDQEARRAVIAAQLRGRPVADDLDLNEVVDRTGGLTPAALSAIVEEAALTAFRESTTTNQVVPITTGRLLGALLARGGADRPTQSGHGWDDLILDDETKAELRQLQRLVEDPELVRKFGVEPPSGLLLAGPPGTGKTTIARVFAAEVRSSFYSVSAADLTSKWVGESEQRVQSLFARARDNAPSIIFLDELDAIARKRLANPDIGDRQLTQLLTEIDGLNSSPGVFVIGATNRPDMLDAAITRGGRLSRTIVVPLPDLDARRAILELHARRMPLAAVDLEAVARVTEGFSGGDLKAVCQQAAINALMRADSGAKAGEPRGDAQVRLEDFAEAVAAIHASRNALTVRPPGSR